MKNRILKKKRKKKKRQFVKLKNSILKLQL